jgi:branched-chain amino acid transport system permease protein
MTSSGTSTWDSEGATLSRFLFLTFSGLSAGAIYAAVALALVLIRRGTGVINFAQGVLGVAAAYVAYSVTGASGSYWAGFVAALASGLVIGLVVERATIRPVARAPHLSVVIVTLGLVLTIQGVLGMIYGNDYLPAQAPFSQSSLTVDGVALLSPYDLFVFGCILVLILGLGALFTRTAVGLRMRATGFAPDVARLLGVHAGRMQTLGWVLAGTVGALAAMLAIPDTLGLNPNAMDLVFISAFTGAVAGGLDSPHGAVAGGLLIGVALSYVSGYLGAGAAPLAVLGLLAVILLARPTGLFASVPARRV